MEKAVPGWTLEELANLLHGELLGPSDFRILRPVPTDENDPDGITFAESSKYLRLAEESSVGAILIDRSAEAPRKPSIRVDDPREAFFQLLQMASKPTIL